MGYSYRVYTFVADLSQIFLYTFMNLWFIYLNALARCRRTKKQIGAMTNTIITKLPSVGSAISSTGLIYSVSINDSIDFETGPVDIEDASSEWFESLDSADAETVNNIITNNSN